MIYGSVCSGIESASIAWEPLGWSAAWFAEIEPFPSAVLAHHWPRVANLGDMCNLPTLIRYGLIKAPDVLVGGTPCQAFSVAGMRGGLEDERGQLTIKYVEVANAIDEKRPEGEECIVVWENVPGVLSSKDNAFGCFLGKLVGDSVALEPEPKPPIGKSSKFWRWAKKNRKHIPKWGKSGIVYGPQRVAAWRILDAQYFGVAQRRRRVFVIASARDGFNPAEVLFESESLRRDTPPSRETGEEITGNAGESAYSTSGAGYWRDGISALRSREQDSHENIITMAHGQGGAEVRKDGKSPTITCNHEASIVCYGAQGPLVLEDIAFPLGRNGGRENVFAVRTAQTSANGHGVAEDITHTLDGANGPAVAFEPRYYTRNQGGAKGSDIMGALSAEFYGSSDKAPHVYTPEMQVRRLTPKECERLQGFPDDHVLISWRGKSPEDCPDGPRYKAVGNSKPVPVIQWIGRRIANAIK